MFVLSFNAANYFQLNKMFLFSQFFFNARKSCTSFIEIPFSDEKFLHEKIFPHKPLPSPPPQREKVHLKTCNTS